jgi:anti-sigma factor RsiW
MLLDRLSAYVDGDLPAPQCATIARHCRTCRRCMKAVADLRATIGLCRRAASTPLPPAVRRRARARIRALLAERRAPTSGR